MSYYVHTDVNGFVCVILFLHRCEAVVVGGAHLEVVDVNDTDFVMNDVNKVVNDAHDVDDVDVDVDDTDVDAVKNVVVTVNTDVYDVGGVVTDVSAVQNKGFDLGRNGKETIELGTAVNFDAIGDNNGGDDVDEARYVNVDDGVSVDNTFLMDKGDDFAVYGEGVVVVNVDVAEDNDDGEDAGPVSIDDGVGTDIELM